MSQRFPEVASCCGSRIVDRLVVSEIVCDAYAQDFLVSLPKFNGQQQVRGLVNESKATMRRSRWLRVWVWFVVNDFEPTDFSAGVRRVVSAERHQLFSRVFVRLELGQTLLYQTVRDLALHLPPASC